METNQPIPTTEKEPTPQPAVKESRAVKKRAGIWRRIGMVLLMLLLFVLILGFGTGLAIQLPFFRHLVLSEVASAIESGTNGRLLFGDLNGNLLEGFVLNDVTLRLRTGTAYDSIPLVHVDRIIARYSLLRWLRTNEFGISSLVIQHPVVHLVKFAGDSIWNYDRLVKSSTPGTKPNPFSQILDVAYFQIQNGDFSLRDYNEPENTSKPSSINFAEGTDALDWGNIHIEGLDLESRLYANGLAAQSVSVSHLRMLEEHSGFFIAHLACSAHLDSMIARMDSATISTGHSNIKFSIEVAPPKIIETGLLTSIQHSSVKANFAGPVISTKELKQFLPVPLGFLSGSPGIDLVATGEFGKLHIQRLALDFKNRGSIDLSGDIDNLQDADSLTMNIDLHGKNLSNTTLDDYIPGLHLLNLTRCGNIDINELSFDGAPQNFHTNFDVKSSGAGDATGQVKLDIRKKQIDYRADVKTSNFNIAAIASNPDLESSITAEATIAGHGTNWRTMESTLAVRTKGPSSFMNYQVSSLDVGGNIKDGTITANHVDAIVQGGPEIHVRSAMAELNSPTIPFRFDGLVKNFLLSQIITDRPQNPARVDLDANISGTAKDFDHVNGFANFRLFDLSCQGHALPDDTASITISDTGLGEHFLTLNSSVADLVINGRFEAGDLINVLPKHVNALITALENRDFPESNSFSIPKNLSEDSIDLDYRIHIKDLRALADFFPNTFLLGQGTVSGSIRGNANGFLSLDAKADSLAFILRNRTMTDSQKLIVVDSLSGTTANRYRDSSVFALPKFGSGTPRIHLMPTTFQVNLHNLSNDPKEALGALDVKLDVTTDSVIRLGSALLFHPKFSLFYQDERLQFGAEAMYNNAIGIDLNGSARFPRGDLDFTLDTLALSYKNPYFTTTNGDLHEFIWRNDGPARFRLSREGVLTLDTINILHPMKNGQDPGYLNAQRMSFGGLLNSDTVDAWARFPSFELEDLRKILPFNPTSSAFDFAKYSGKVRDFQVTLGGTLEQPNISAKLFADSIRYKGQDDDTITFDSNYINASYRDQILRGIMDLHVAKVSANAPNVISPMDLKGGELRATIDSIPIAFTLRQGPNYGADSARAATTPLSASIDAEQFPLDIATPFLPPFRQILGLGDIHFKVSGTRQNIDYAGNAFIRNGALLLSATNMWYLFGGPLTFAHDSLLLQNDSIHNISSDDSLGAARLSGNFLFHGFDITNFDLHLRSNRIMVLSDAAKESLPMAYGPVTINTGGQDFRFYHTFDEPWINGTINIMNANVTMPQTDNGAHALSNEGVIYEMIPTDSVPLDSKSIHASQNAPHQYDAQIASVQMSEVDDTLFPNWMKDIFLNDVGRAEIADSSTTNNATSNTGGLAPTFTDKLRMNLRLNTEGTAAITIPFGGLQILGSQLRAELKSGGTVKIDRGDNLNSQASGAFELSPNSIFTFVQNFTIPEGSIQFTRNFGNPALDIKAEYIGTHQNGSSSPPQAKIDLDVTGTKNHPIITAMNYQQATLGGDFEVRTERSADEAEQDAIYFLTTGGYFKNDLTGANSGSAYTKMLPALGGQLAANLAANIVGSTSSQFAIRAASFSAGSNAGAQITGAYRDITIKLGAGVGSYGLNLATDISLSTFWPDPIARNFLIEVQANDNPTNSNAGTLTQQPSFLTKFIYTWHP